MTKNSFYFFAAPAMLLAACNSSPPPVAAPLPDLDAPGAQMLIAKCTQCHGAPQPTSHNAEEWPGVIDRMNMHRNNKAYSVLTQDERAVLLGYLSVHGRKGVAQ